MLYWDEVGTIVPSRWIHDPEQLGEHTLELVRRGLLRQRFPEEVGVEHRDRFRNWLHGLDDAALAERRANFASHHRMRIHADKWLVFMSGVQDVDDLGLAEIRRGGGDGWVDVETTTAFEFMATLALVLCHPHSTPAGSAPGATTRWVPATDNTAAFAALLAGLSPLDATPSPARDLMLRIHGEMRVSQLRTTLLERALPVPEQAPTPEQLERFRARHGDRLPALRRRIDVFLDEAVGVADEVLQFRKLERLSDEIEEMVTAAERYLEEAGLRRVRRSPLLRAMKAVPGLTGPAGAAQETAAALEKAAGVEVEPLAYLAFARAELNLDASYERQGLQPALAEVFA